MKNRTMLLLLSLILALATAGAAFAWLKTQSGESSKPLEKAEMIVAKEEISSGTQITEKMLDKVMVAKNLIPSGIYTDVKEIIGLYAKETILKGEGFPTQRLYSEEDKLLSMRLSPGYRAFSITMTRFSGVADLLKAGDRVDAFVYLKLIEKNNETVRADVAQILLQNIEVLAVRKEAQKDSTPPEKVDELYAVTVAVPVKAVEKLILAEETGIIKLALRPIGDSDTYISYGVMWKELLLDSNLNIRDFDPEYGTVESTDILNNVKLNRPSVSTPATTSETEQKPASTNTPVTGTSGQTQNPQPTVKPSYSIYTVQAGDTLMSISRKYFNGSASYYDDIMRMNNLTEQTIKPGQKLKIPLSGR